MDHRPSTSPARRRARLLPLLLVLSAACRSGDTPGSTEPTPAAEQPFASEVLAAVQDYRDLPLAGQFLNWSPLDCRAAPPPQVQVSASDDDDTHGRKLYVLHVEPQLEYLRLSSLLLDEVAAMHHLRRPTGPFVAPVGMVLVKRSFVPVHVDEAPRLTWDAEQRAELERVGFHPYTTDDNGEVYRASDPGPLFAMLKLDPGTPGTDQGWVYATLTPEGELTASGLLPNCIRCHERAPHDRLFGPTW